jgi:hypothetical protein
MTTTHRQSRPHPWLLIPAAAIGLAMAGPAALAAPADDLIKRAESACLDSAVSQGWQRELAQVVSSRQISADKVEVVFDLSRDGSNRARLTCPFSGSQGVIGQLAGVGQKLAADAGTAANSAANSAGNHATDYGKDFTESMATTAKDAGQAVQRSRAWWLLLPVGLAALCWASLRNRDRSAAGVVFDHDQAHGYGNAAGSRTAEAFVAEAINNDPLGDGMVSVHETSDRSSPVRRRIPSGDHLSLTGRRLDDWMEVDGGGWVRQRHLRIGNTAVSAGRNDA